MPHRSVVLVSHANPEDNPFARWLSLKLAALGYNVWSDVTKLLGGEDFWQEIEAIIRVVRGHGVLPVHVAPVAEPYDEDAHGVVLHVANHAIISDPIAP